jgi:Bax protein
VRILLIFFLFFFLGNLQAATSKNNFSRQQKTFIHRLLPELVAVNKSLLVQHHRLSRLYLKWKKSHFLTPKERQWLGRLNQKFRLKSLYVRQRDWEKLLERVDIVPVSLGLAQGINESGWGRSRFAKLANNFFGRWCFKKGCGVVPKRRTPGKTHQIKYYRSMHASIVDYMKGLNTHQAYRDFRHRRFLRREKGQRLMGEDLAMALVHYSSRGKQYVKSLQHLIRHYKLFRFD